MSIISLREYNAIHKWNLRHWTKTGVCEFCKVRLKTQWSNKSGDYTKGDKADWQELCVRCHVRYDDAKFGHLRSRGRPNITKRKTRLIIYHYYINELTRLQKYIWFEV